MYRITYRGLTEAEKAQKMSSHMENAVPPEKHGKKPVYKILDKDKEDVKEQKRKLTAEWKARAEREFRAEVEAADAAMEVRGARLPKGVPVELPDDHMLCDVPRNKRTGEILGQSKAQSLAAAGIVDLEHIEEPPRKVAPPVAPVSEPETVMVDGHEEPEKRKPGRPAKAKE